MLYNILINNDKCSSDNVVVDEVRGEAICADTGEVIAEHLPALYVGIEETSVARVIERLERYEEKVETRKQRYRYAKSYKRVVRIIARYKNRKCFSPQELELLRRIVSGQLTTWDVAKILNVSPKTVYNWLQKAKREGWI